MKQIPLTQSKHALVDDEDFDWLSKKKWCASNVAMSKNNASPEWYAWRTERVDGKRRMVCMHQVLAKEMGADKVDHINNDGLDNRRENLRDATCAQNNRNTKLRIDNTSGYKGVHLMGNSKKWVASICVNRVKKYLGSFPSKIHAARAYDAAAREHFGEFARVNFPKAGEQGALE